MAVAMAKFKSLDLAGARLHGIADRAGTSLSAVSTSFGVKRACAVGLFGGLPRRRNDDPSPSGDHDRPETQP
jgi:hypothetical protein